MYKITVLLCLFGLSVLNLEGYAQYLDSVEGDRQALEDLYHVTGGDNWHNDSGWLRGNPSNHWYGVKVDKNGRVIKVNLKDNNLRGSNGLPASIGNLKKMDYFNVMFNEIGGDLPQELFSQCSSLVYLYLNFSDDVLGRRIDPHEKTRIGGGDVHTGKQPRATGAGAWNTFTGEVPASFNLPDLEWFALTWTDISKIDQAIFTSSKLKGLWIGNNDNLGGNEQKVPGYVGNLSQLEHLDLSSSPGESSEHAWGGELPMEFSNLISLKSLRISGNSFVGAFPNLSRSTGMQTFVIGDNKFTSGFPVYGLSGKWPNINAFSVSYTNFRDAHLPENVPHTLKTLNLPQAGVSGSLSEKLFPRQIIVTDFSWNNLTGPSPANLRHLVRIRNLRWGDNELSGPWPDLDWTNKQRLTNSAGKLIHPLRDLTRAHFSHNKYVFADMLVVTDEGKTLFEWYRQVANVSFKYAPQKKFGTEENEAKGIIDFSNVVTHKDNKYTWYRNGNVIPEESQNVMDASAHGPGIYSLKVTNFNIPDLTLESIDIEIAKSDIDSESGKIR